MQRLATAAMLVMLLPIIAYAHPTDAAVKSEHMTDASERVDAFESALALAQTRTRRLSEVGLKRPGRVARIGPQRAAPHLRAQAIAHSERVVEAHNQRHAAGHASYTMALNELSDLSDREYLAFLKSRPDAAPLGAHAGLSGHSVHGHVHGKRVSVTTVSSANASGTSSAAATDPNANATIPKEVNWLTIENGKYVTPVKNQGTCGSCWAFSGIAVVESRYAIANKVPASPLSVEQVLSCSAPLDHIRSKFAKDMTSSSQGCDGGMPFLTFEYMSRVSPFGVACEDAYPYVMATTGGETQCQAVSASNVAVAWKNQTSSYVAIASSDEAALLRAVMSGPVSANLDASGDGFKLYASGVYDAKDCSSNGKDVNHAVVLTGFGETAAGEKYWLVRNTWGTMWGENGYMRIARGGAVSPNGPCNLYLYSSYPVNLATGSTSASRAGGATCALPAIKFEALPTSAVIGFGVRQFLLLFGSSVLAVGAGMAYYWVTERRLDIKQKAGSDKYKDSYKRWVLPTREQLLANLAARPSAEV
ncbi:hypothetical protein PybrP1_008850 [[Pythium] brassicae (nom. inval.)]|nr:hypothetical protein PybrP1_008850 [[Pythium] brassicae (nom. inval.)]